MSLSKKSRATTEMMAEASIACFNFLSFYEIILFHGVSKFCGLIIQESPHLFHQIQIIGNHLVDDDALLRLWKLVGTSQNQVRSIRMQNLTSVSSLGFALPCGMNHLSEICIVNCAYQYGSGAFSNFKIIDGPHLLQLLFEHPHPKLRKVRFAGCAGLTEAHLENLHQQYGVIDFDLFTCHQCQEMSAIQSQCTMKGCQPSTIALCSECTGPSDYTHQQAILIHVLHYSLVRSQTELSTALKTAMKGRVLWVCVLHKAPEMTMTVGWLENELIHSPSLLTEYIQYFQTHDKDVTEWLVSLQHVDVNGYYVHVAVSAVEVSHVQLGALSIRCHCVNQKM